MPDDRVAILESSRTGGGHRGDYLRLLSAVLSARTGLLRWRDVTVPCPVLVPMIEGAFLKYVVVGVIRSLFGHTTTGFLFRPLPAVSGSSLRLRAKRVVLRALRRVPKVCTLTIVPFSLDERFATIADGWIHDPQTWDIGVMPGSDWAASRDLATAIRSSAKGRTVCCAVGRQTADKGFDLFARYWCDSPDLRDQSLFAFGGAVGPPLKDLADRFAEAGGFALDRFIDDQELVDLYAAADLLWCVYAPQYDQASGIAGRAMQLGIPIVVREGSLIHRLCIAEDHPHIALDSDGPLRLETRCPARADLTTASRRAQARMEESLATLRAGLGIACG